MTSLLFQETAILSYIQKFNTQTSLCQATITASFISLVALVFLDLIFTPSCGEVSLILDLEFASPWTLSSLSVERGTVSSGWWPWEKC